MSIDRKIPTIADHPGGIDGDDFADAIQEEFDGVWGMLGGILATVVGTNAITATLPVTITAYTHGLRCSLVPVANNTANVTINVDGVGVVNLLGADGNPIPANGLVSGVRTNIEYDSIIGAFVIVGGSGSGSGGLASKVVVGQNQQTNGTAGGGATAGSYQIYPINTSVLNELSGEGVAFSGSAAFTIGPFPAGTYDVHAVVPFHLVARARLRLWNTTDGAVVTGLTSDTIRATTTNEIKSASLRGRFVITSAKSFRLEFRVETTRATDGLGQAASFTETERYGFITIARPAEGSLGLGSIATHNLTISALSPSGGNDGDIWFKVVP